MKKKSAVLGMAAAAAFSGASFSALAGPTVPVCTGSPPNSHLSSYLPGQPNATCTVLDKTISGVSASGNIDADATFVRPQTVTNNPGLAFLPSSDGSNPITVTFTITAPSTDPITDASLSLGLNGATVTASETLSNGKSLSASNSTPTDDVTFAPTTVLTVTDSLTISSDFLSFTNQFSETPVTTPEPSSLALLGVALPAFGLAQRRKRS